VEQEATRHAFESSKEQTFFTFNKSSLNSASTFAAKGQDCQLKAQQLPAANQPMNDQKDSLLKKQINSLLKDQTLRF